MNVFVITGNQIERDNYISHFIFLHKILPYHVERFGPGVKISDARGLKQKLSIKTSSQEYRLFVIEESITSEAQNALLKSIEELVENIFIIFSIAQKDILLPTILSRTQVLSIPVSTENKAQVLGLPDLFLAEKNPLQFLEFCNAHYNGFLTNDDLKSFMLDIRNAISTTLYQQKLPSPMLLRKYEKLCILYPLSVTNNINKRLLIETTFFEK